MEQIPSPESGKFPARSVVLGLVAVQSVVGLVSDSELGGVIKELTGQATLANDIDYFGTIVDSAFAAYGTNVLLNQAGIIKEDPTSTKSETLNNMEIEIKLDIGREPGTWMPKEWAASGTRLSIPLKLRFSDELVDLGFPGEETLSGGGSRYAKRVYCESTEADSVPQPKANETPQEKAARERAEDAARRQPPPTRGKVVAGAWLAERSGVPGASTFNFFLDFEGDTTSGDVTLNGGRVFCSGAYWEGTEALPTGIIEGAVDMPGDGGKAGVVSGPNGIFVLDQGGVTIKRNDWRNLFGALGQVTLIVGKFTAVKPPPFVPQPKANETPQEKAARERAEDAARGRFI